MRQILTSRTVLSGLVAILAGVAGLWGWHIDPAIQNDLIAVLSPSLAILGGAGSILFRILAKDCLSGAFSGVKWYSLLSLSNKKDHPMPLDSTTEAEIIAVGNTIAAVAAGVIKEKETDPAKLASIASTATVAGDVFTIIGAILAALGTALAVTAANVPPKAP